MARTPEGDEKKKVKDFLDAIGAYHFWPVQTGYGAPALDCYACFRGWFLAIEVKAPGGRYTARQKFIMQRLKLEGAHVIGGTADEIIRDLTSWRAAGWPLPR